MIFLIVTEWRDDVEGVRFTRTHERDCLIVEEAIQAERDHNATREAVMAEDGFAWRIVRFKRKGEQAWCYTPLRPSWP